MGQFKDAIDKQFPPKTDQQRAEYRALRAHLDASPVPRMFLVLAVVLFLAIPFVYCATASASPVIVPVMSAGAIVAQRNSEHPSVPARNESRWEGGPCDGAYVSDCTPVRKVSK